MCGARCRWPPARQPWGGAALALGLPWQAALVFGFGFSLSSTAIALQSLAERNQASTDTGQTTVALSLAQDIQSIPMLAIVPALGVGAAVVGAEVAGAGHGAAHGAGGWFTAAKALGVVVLIVFGGRYLVRPLFRLIARSDVREIFTATALLLVVGVASLMHLVELSMGLGAFLAGVLLAESEYRKELETDIEPFKGLLLGLFFIAVGMSIDFAVLWAQPLVALGLTLGFVAIKFAIMRPMARLIGIATPQRNLFAVLIAQGSEFAFVLFAAAGAAGVVAAQTASLWVGAVALSMLLTPALLIAVDWRQRRCEGLQAPSRADDEISADEVKDAPIIICGFGRYGQIIGRLLLANGLRPTVLDHDPELVDTSRQFGFKVFYGDATRLDLLRSAGAAQASVVVVAVDNVEASLAIIDLCKEHFPNLRLVARARDMTHVYALLDRGVGQFARETFESALVSARQTLELVGYGAHEARQLAMKFRRHNLELIQKVYPHNKDRERLIAVAKETRQQLEEMFASEREATRKALARGREAWDDASHDTPEAKKEP